MSLSIFSAARQAPHAEALVCDGQRLSFSALAARVQARRGQLERLGVRPLASAPVALVVDGSLSMFEWLYLCLELGVPVLPLHPRLTAPERESLVRASGAACTIDPSQTEPGAETAEAREVFAVPEHQPLAWVPSSGSTGRPKLVELSRRAFRALCAADAQRVPPRSADRA
ncbi:MAG TPA: AMP-binding protein, partial [Polyangiaceae bacterium]